MPIPWEPRDYQYTSAKFLVEHAHAALFHAPSLGKTSSTLAAFSHLKKKGVARKALVLAPLRVCDIVWPREVKKWKDFAHLKTQFLHGARKDRVDFDADIYLVNFEGLSWFLDAVTEIVVPTKGKHAGKERRHFTTDPWRIKELGIDTLIIDELTKFKHTYSKGFRIMKQVHHLFARRWGLTGSPAANHMLDLFGQVYVLDGGRSFGEYITRYRFKYFTPDRNGFSWTIKPGAEKEIYQRISPLVLRMSDEDYLKLPKVTEHTIEVELEPKAAKVYKEMWKHLVSEIESGVVVASNAADKINKCRQLLGGALYLDKDSPKNLKRKRGEMRPFEVVSRAKLDALEELVEELQGEPLLVGYEYQHEGERIGKAIKGAVVVSDLTDKKFREVEAAWNRGEIPVLAAHPATIGHGLNLQGDCKHVCWFTSTWNGELDDQFIRRVRRFGNQYKKIFVHRIHVPGSVDDAVVEALQSKEKTQRALFNGLVKLAKKSGFKLEKGRL